MTLGRTWPLLLCLFGLWGCGSDDEIMPPPARGGVGDPCAMDLQCAAGLRCENRVCVADVDASAPVPDASVDAMVDAGPARCLVGVTEEPFEDAELSYHWRGAGLPLPEYEQVISTPVVIDFLPEITGTSVPEVIFISYRQPDQGAVLRVMSGKAPHETRMTLSGDGSGPLTAERTGVPSLRYDSHPATGDLDGDGSPEVVAILEDGGAVAWRANGEQMWRAFFPDVEAGTSGAVAIADVDRDGQAEVVIGRMVIDGLTGRVDWVGTRGRGINIMGPISCVADVNGEGGMEVVAGRTVYLASGEVLWEGRESSGDGFCAIADLFDESGETGTDGRPEVIRVADSTLIIHDGATGEVVWERSLSSCSRNRGRGGPPTVADFDGDGVPEIGVAGAYCYVVYDPICEAAGVPAGCQTSGTLWRIVTEDASSSVTGSTVFDFNGDGRAEVIYNDEEYFRVLDGRDGSVIFSDPNPSRTRTEQPIVADVDNDGNAEIVFVANTLASFAGDTIPVEERIPGVEIWQSGSDSWVGARPVWNQHTFHLDNVGADGRIPTNETASWSSHNSYRLNYADLDALAAPDLVPGGIRTDPAGCGGAGLLICAEVRNLGETRFGSGIEVAFYAGDPSSGGMFIAEGNTVGTAGPGEMTEACISWPEAPSEDVDIWVVVDVDDRERECREDNNAGRIGSARCPLVE